MTGRHGVSDARGHRFAIDRRLLPDRARTESDPQFRERLRRAWDASGEALRFRRASRTAQAGLVLLFGFLMLPIVLLGRGAMPGVAVASVVTLCIAGLLAGVFFVRGLLGWLRRGERRLVRACLAERVCPVCAADLRSAPRSVEGWATCEGCAAAWDVTDRCDACGYRLAGLPAGPEGIIVCPECGWYAIGIAAEGRNEAPAKSEPYPAH